MARPENSSDGCDKEECDIAGPFRTYRSKTHAGFEREGR